MQERINEYGPERENLKRPITLVVSLPEQRINTTWHQASSAGLSPSASTREAVADRQHALSHRNASHCRAVKAKFVGPHRRGTRRGKRDHMAAYLAAVNALAVAAAAFGIAGQSYANRSARRCWVATSGDVREQPKIADGRFRVAAGRFRKRQKP